MQPPKQKLPTFLLLLLATICIFSSASLPLQNKNTVQMALLSMQLPNLTFRLNDVDIVLNNGVLSKPVGPFRSAVLQDRVLFGDFDGDQHLDASVVLQVVYDGIGYFSKVVFGVLGDLVKGATVTNGIHIGMATYRFDVFSVDAENKKIIVGFMDRLPGQPKAAAPSVPTFMFLQVKNNTLETTLIKTVDKSAYPF